MELSSILPTKQRPNDCIYQAINAKYKPRKETLHVLVFYQHERLPGIELAPIILLNPPLPKAPLCSTT